MPGGQCGLSFFIALWYHKENGGLENEKGEENVSSVFGITAVFSWLMLLVNLALVVLGIAVLVLSIRVLLLLIQALRIYIQKNSV